MVEKSFSFGYILIINFYLKNESAKVTFFYFIQKKQELFFIIN